MGRTVIWVVLALGLAAGGWALFGNSTDPGDDPGLGEFDDDALPTDDEDGPGLVGAARTTTGGAPTSVGRYPIRGRVIGPEGEAVGDVAIHVRADGRAMEPSDPSTWGQSLAEVQQRVLDPYEKSPDEQNPLVAEGRADAEGRFEVRVPRFGKFRVYALPRAPRVGTFQSVSLHKSAESADTLLHVLAGAELRGRVLDAKDKPLAVQVRARLSGMVDGVYRAWASDRLESSASDGTFHLPAAPLGRVRFELMLSSGLRVSGFSTEVPHDGVFTMRLAATGGAVEGVVTDASQTPVAGAHVVVSVRAEKTETRDASSTGARVTTDAEGRYRIEGLPAARLSTIRAVAPDFLPYYKHIDAKGEAPPTVPATGAVTFDIELSRGGVVHGRVTESDGQAPIAGAVVSLIRRQGSASSGRSGPTHVHAPITTDAQGRYRFETVSPGTYVALPEAKGYYLPQLKPTGSSSVNYVQPGQNNSAPTALSVVMTAEGKQIERDLALSRGHTITGRVVDASRQGVADAEVFAQGYGLAQVAWTWGIGGRAQEALTRSDASGAFVAEGLPPHSAWVLYARKEGLAGRHAKPFALGGDAKPGALTLELLEGATIQGRVEGLTANEAATAQIGFWGTAQELAAKSSGHKLKPDGSFEMTGVPAGDWTLNVWMNGRQGTQAVVSGLKAGEVRTDVVLKMKEGVEVEGTVVDLDGEPVANLGVILQVVGSGGWNTTSTNSAGRFKFKGIAEGRAQLMTWGAGGRQTPVGRPFETSERDIRVTYDKPVAVTIRGEVQAVDGTPIAVCQVQVRSKAAPRSGNRMGMPVMEGPGNQEALAGRFEIQSSGSGPWAVTASDARGEDGQKLNLRKAGIVVTDPAEAVVLRMEAGLVLEGHVTDAKGKGLGDVVVGIGRVSTRTDPAGAFRMAGLDEGKVVVQVTPPAGMVRPPAQTVDSASTDVRFTLTQGLSIKGTAIGPDGEPLVRGFASATWPDTGSVRQGSAGGQIRAGGVFEVTGVPPGVLVRLQVQVWSSSGGTAFAPAILENVKPGATGVEVRLGGGLTIEGRIVTADGKVPSACFIYGRSKDGKKQTGWVQVNDKGTFRLGGLDPVPYEVRVMLQGGGATPPPQTVTPPATGVEIRLPKTVSLSGRLDGLDSEDGSGWRVRAWREDGTQVGFTNVAADGSWYLTAIADGPPVHVAASKQRDDRYALKTDVKPGAKAVVLQLRAGRTIRGMVDGGVADGRVQAVVGAEGSNGWRGSGMLDKDGTFVIHGVPPGSYKLTARTYGPESKTAEVSGVSDGAEGIRLVLK